MNLSDVIDALMEVLLGVGDVPVEKVEIENGQVHVISQEEKNEIFVPRP